MRSPADTQNLFTLQNAGPTLAQLNSPPNDQELTETTLRSASPPLLDPDPNWIRIQQLCGSGSSHVKKGYIRSKLRLKTKIDIQKISFGAFIFL